MKYVILTIISLTMLVSCSTPVVFDGGYSDGYSDRYDGYEDGYYHYDSRARTASYDRYYETNTYGTTSTNRIIIGQSSIHRNGTGGPYSRYDAYNNHGHSLHSSRYDSFHHGHRRHLY